MSLRSEAVMDACAAGERHGREGRSMQAEHLDPRLDPEVRQARSRSGFPQTIIVSIYRVKCGYLAEPKATRWHDLFLNYMQRWDENATADIFLQGEEQFESWAESVGLSGLQIRDAKNGWTVNVKMPPRDFAAMLGHDCAEIVDAGLNTVAKLNSRYGTPEQDRGGTR